MSSMQSGTARGDLDMRILGVAIFTVTWRRRGGKTMQPDISAVASGGGKLTCFWAKLFSRTLVAQAERRRFNPLKARQNRAVKRPEGQAQNGGSPGRNVLRFAASILLEERP
jgi:hypothetical protein